MYGVLSDLQAFRGTSIALLGYHKSIKVVLKVLCGNLSRARIRPLWEFESSLIKA